MPFIKRDTQGNIIAVSTLVSKECTEEVSLSDEALKAFLTLNTSIKNDNHNVLDALQDSDTKLARVTEDLIYLLIDKKVIMFTELPPVVQEKLLGREKLRASLSQGKPNLLDDEGSI